MRLDRNIDHLTSLFQTLHGNQNKIVYQMNEYQQKNIDLKQSFSHRLISILHRCICTFVLFPSEQNGQAVYGIEFSESHQLTPHLYVCKYVYILYTCICVPIYICSINSNRNEGLFT